LKITPTSLTISQLFSSSNEQFFIPAYQRRYSWEKRQIKELYNDINLLKSSDTHFLGSIVCLTSAYTVGINTLELVDGQQRITSLSIFLKAIKDRFIEFNEDSVVTKIDALLHCEGIDRKAKNKVLLGDLDNPDYEKLINLKNIDQIKNQNMLNAYTYIKGWLDALDIEDLNELYYKFINYAVVVRLDVGEAKDAYKLFETINNRGLSLCPTDIIKNFLLGHASTINEQVLIDVQGNWKELIVNLDGINTDNFFRQLMSSKLNRKITFTYLIDEFKKYYLDVVTEAKELPEYEIYNETTIDSEDSIKNELEETESEQENISKENTETMSIVDFSEHLKNISLIYKNLLNRQFDDSIVNKHLFNLQRIKSFPSYIFLLDVFQRKNIQKNTKVEILKILEVFMMRRHICEYRTGELDDIFSKLVKVSTDNIVHEVKQNLKKDLPSDSDFEYKFSLASFKGNENRAKYVLEIFEYKNIGHQGEYTLNTGADLHLEHIIPKTIDTKKSKKEFGDWIEYLGDNSLEKHKTYVNRIGNFTLLGQKLNIVASNNPFKDKLIEYRKSNISLTTDIAKNFTSFKFIDVEERSISMGKEAIELWSII
jgi:uncharacterized protein with ParB-like and HNH nuclease domain